MSQIDRRAPMKLGDRKPMAEREMFWRVLLPISLATGLSLIGDSALYTVLPTHTADAGIMLASLGLMLSINRFVRLGSNSLAGWLLDRIPRRTMFVPAAIAAALSTALYAFPATMLVSRVLWGVAWSAIWVAGNAIIMDVSDETNRGRWLGRYHASFFLGAAGGAVLGGHFTDWLGYRQAMLALALLTAVGALSAVVLLVETRPERSGDEPRRKSGRRSGSLRLDRKTIGALMLLAANRLVMAGVFYSTIALFLARILGQQVSILGREIGISTVTGVSMGVTTLVGMAAAPFVGRVSDRTGNRWSVASGGLLVGSIGYLLVALSNPLTIFLGMPLVSFASGSNQGLATAIVGDQTMISQRGRRLALFFTVGDLASALGPPLAYALDPHIGLAKVYLMAAGLLLLTMVMALWQSARNHRS